MGSRIPTPKVRYKVEEIDFIEGWKSVYIKELVL